MSSMVAFERLPAELIHKIFDYLQSDEIFISFGHVHTYDRYRLNFQSITMSNFLFTLQYLDPSQVITLTLSNTNDTPGQFQQFLALFSLKQFLRLQSLRLIQPSNPIDLNQILTDLHKLDFLQLLSIIHCQPTSVNQQTFLIFSSFLNTSTSLRRLDLSGPLNALFEYPFLSSIHHLYFNDNIFNTIPLQTITARMPDLKSLDSAITLKINPLHFPSLIHLTRLTLTIFINMNNSDLKALINPMSSLRFLKLIANGKQWFNGHFWEECLPVNLRRFQFNFCTQSIHLNEEMFFETFQTSFWLRKKRWYVMLDYQMNPTMTHLYSLPYCDTQFYYRPTMDSKRMFRSSISMEKSYLDNVTKLTIDLSTLITECNTTLSSKHFFSNVSTLILSDGGGQLSIEPLFNFLKSILDLNRIVELKLGHFHHSDLIQILYNHMSGLNSLRIPETTLVKLEMIDFRKITSLAICDCLTDVEKIYKMFSYIKHLCVKLISLENMQEVIKFFEKSLINVTFRQINRDVQEPFIKWLEEYYGESRRFSYDIDEHMNLHLWLNDLLK